MAGQVEQTMQLADETAKAAEQAREAAKPQNEEVIWAPNAIRFKAKPFVEMRTRMNRKQYAIFTDEEETKKILKEVKPGYHYHWARHPQYEAQTGMRVAMGLYEYVSPKEVKAELFPIFANHKGTSGNMVAFGTLVLVAESPAAWSETHIDPQVEAMARLARQEESFQANVEEESQGHAKGTIERVFQKDENV